MHRICEGTLLRFRFHLSIGKAYRKNFKSIKVFKLSLLGMNAVNKPNCDLFKLFTGLNLLFLMQQYVLLYPLNRSMNCKLNIGCILKCIKVIIRVSNHDFVFTAQISFAYVKQKGL